MDGNSLSIVWDVPENVSKVRERAAVLFRGCSCKTGCKTRRCKCVQKSSKCSAGCKCLNCANLTLKPSPPRYKEDNVSSSDSDGEDGSPSDLTGDNFMKLVFGEENEDEELW